MIRHSNEICTLHQWLFNDAAMQHWTRGREFGLGRVQQAAV
ncbi:hypothetical protein [Yoonia sp.]